ncbi:argininosuccinate lyase-like isoform X2 [Paramacrobiotus metropolitanus]|uniref:argininosuccinate lyase-like isoform X2 n=1 Tax=Paramacrobiotus metropolitanus TaxID=2943436 RepID=UPI00244631D8|nr:argininosuccinate lyase-like isoform X2 [Paramacrobiotus metropolitanus]
MSESINSHPDCSRSVQNGMKMWGGRFAAGPSSSMDALNKSISFDQRLWQVDIDGSVAYAKETDEDIHTANERRLTEIIGPVGGKLHTGRSRNDQVATDLRMWLKDEIVIIEGLLVKILDVLCNRAETELDIVMPGYTHLQRAQPVRWSHFLMSYAVSFKSDYVRLNSLLPEIDELPLGSGAVAGNPLGINREYLASLLAFSNVALNSMHAVSDRDFVAQFLQWAALTGIHLSRLSEDLIIYSTKEFRFITMSDQYSSGSSLMPQKKNPDVLELLRGKAGRLIGNHTGFMCTLKGLPSTYSKDLQEDKEPLFDSVDQIKIMLDAAHGVLATLTINANACRSALSFDMLATDVAYYLVRKGVPFREAHHIVGKLVVLAEGKQCHLKDIALKDLQSIDHRFADDYAQIWDFEKSMEQYSATGSTAHAAVWQQIATIREFIMNTKERFTIEQ